MESGARLQNSPGIFSRRVNGDSLGGVPIKRPHFFMREHGARMVLEAGSWPASTDRASLGGNSSPLTYTHIASGREDFCHDMKTFFHGLLHVGAVVLQAGIAAGHFAPPPWNIAAAAGIATVQGIIAISAHRAKQ